MLRSVSFDGSELSFDCQRCRDSFEQLLPYVPACFKPLKSFAYYFFELLNFIVVKLLEFVL